MLMEFLPGGDLMTMLIKYEIFSEDITRFYMAELTLAIEAVHKLGFIHRCVLLKVIFTLDDITDVDAATLNQTTSSSTAAVTSN